MNKRKFKKQLQYDIADAVEIVLLKSAKNKDANEEMNKRIDSLLEAYDTAFHKIHTEKTLAGRKERKKHFTELRSQFDKDIESIYSGK